MKHVWNFLKRGLMAAAGGPMILAIIYAILGATGVEESLSPAEVCKGILTSQLLAFVAAGISVVYEIERLPLLPATLLHGLALYADYILIYLVNGWIKQRLADILVFTGIFLLGYGVIWITIWLCIRANIQKINTRMKKDLA